MSEEERCLAGNDVVVDVEEDGDDDDKSDYSFGSDPYDYGFSDAPASTMMEDNTSTADNHFHKLGEDTIATILSFLPPSTTFLTVSILDKSFKQAIDDSRGFWVFYMTRYLRFGSCLKETKKRGVTLDLPTLKKICKQLLLMKDMVLLGHAPAMFDRSASLQDEFYARVTSTDEIVQSVYNCLRPSLLRRRYNNNSSTYEKVGHAISGEGQVSLSDENSVFQFRREVSTKSL